MREETGKQKNFRQEGGVEPLALSCSTDLKSAPRTDEDHPDLVSFQPSRLRQTQSFLTMEGSTIFVKARKGSLNHSARGRIRLMIVAAIPYVVEHDAQCRHARVSNRSDTWQNLPITRMCTSRAGGEEESGGRREGKGKQEPGVGGGGGRKVQMLILWVVSSAEAREQTT